MTRIWSQYITLGKHLYLNKEEHLIAKNIERKQFDGHFIIDDRRQTLKNIKQILKPASYNKFLNKFRVYKNRIISDNIELSVSKYNFQTISTLTTKLGYKTKNETIELLCQYYAECHDIKLN